MSERIRLTITVSKEVHEVFQRMAEASGLSLSRIMGSWLEDTREGAQLVTQKIEEARAAPSRVMQGLAPEDWSDEAHAARVSARAASRQVARAAGDLARRSAVQPPSSNTGVNPLGKPLPGRRKA